jgi:hypothetical protein
MANGKWQMANAKWQMPNGKCQMANRDDHLPFVILNLALTNVST